MAIKLTDENELNKVAGSALIYESNDKFLFICTHCGYFWTGNDGDPTKVHGCKRCGWWFKTLKDNGNWEKECVAFIPLKVFKHIKKRGNINNYNFSLNFKLF